MGFRIILPALLLLVLLVPSVSSVGNGPYVAQDVFCKDIIANGTADSYAWSGTPTWNPSGGLNFSTTADYVTIGDSNVTRITTDSITIEMWFAPYTTFATPDFADMVGKHTYTAQYWFAVTSANKPILYSAGASHGIASTALTLGAIQMIAIAYNCTSGNYTYYHNGVADGTGTSTGTLPVAALDLFLFRPLGGSYNMNCTAYCIRIYDRELSGTEVLTDYNAGKASISTTSSLKVWYKFNEGTGTTLYGYDEMQTTTAPTIYSHYWDQTDGTTTYQYNFTGNTNTTAINCTFPISQNVTDVFDGAGNALPVSDYSTEAYNSTHSVLVLNSTTIATYGTGYKFTTVLKEVLITSGMSYISFVLLFAFGLVSLLLSFYCTDTILKGRQSVGALIFPILSAVLWGVLAFSTFTISMGVITFVDWIPATIYSAICVLSALLTVYNIFAYMNLMWKGKYGAAD